MSYFEYRKSSYSDEEDECVEMATNIPTTVAVRDSKNPTGPHLRFARSAWLAFEVVLTSRD